jgi:hypothetical protein
LPPNSRVAACVDFVVGILEARYGSFGTDGCVECTVLGFATGGFEIVGSFNWASFVASYIVHVLQVTSSDRSDMLIINTLPYIPLTGFS